MSILIEDSPRNLAKWVATAAQDGLARGLVINPWATPWVNLPNRKRTALDTATVVAKDGEVWFDPLTHALQMSGTGDFRFYDEFSLWSGSRGDLSTPANRGEHLRRVFEIQDELGAPHLAPTVLLHHGQSSTSQLALELSDDALERDPGAWLSIAGTASFWSSGKDLDAHIGALAQLQPQGWFLTVVRPLYVLPVSADPSEVHGLCRTARALSEYSRIHVSHGDLAALPAVAAGAASVGSGWDQRQRVCAMASFAARDDNEGGGGWFERPTLQGLAGFVKRPEAQLLQQRDAALLARLGVVPPPGPEEAFRAHLSALDTLLSAITGDYATRYMALDAIYTSAATDWPVVQRLTSCEQDASDWIEDPAAGLKLYGIDEGWATP